MSLVADQATLSELPEAKQYLTVNVYRHLPPKVDGCPLADSECAACQLSMAPSNSFYQVSICEKDLLGGSSGNAASASASFSRTNLDISIQSRGYTIDQVAYCVEMCEDTFKVQC